MVKPELKPCPFCGGEKAKNVSITKDHNTVYCRDCGASVGEFHKTKKLAIDAWNERASQPIPPHIIKELEKVAKKIHDGVEVCNMCVAEGICDLTDINHEDYQCRYVIAKYLARAAGWEA